MEVVTEKKMIVAKCSKCKVVMNYDSVEEMFDAMWYQGTCVDCQHEDNHSGEG